jgi:hypothetical protein
MLRNWVERVDRISRISIAEFQARVCLNFNSIDGGFAMILAETDGGATK